MAFEIYKPIMVASVCSDCHDDKKLGTVGGVALLRLSTDTLVKSRQNWSTAAAQIQRADVTVAAVTTAVIVCAFLVLVYWTVKRLITQPLDQVIRHLQQGADQLGLSSGEISASSQTLAEGSSEQAASLEETSASLEEMSSMTKRNADNAQKAKDLPARPAPPPITAPPTCRR